jgi:transcriptional regulator with XRE-family HTH domain
MSRTVTKRPTRRARTPQNIMARYAQRLDMSGAELARRIEMSQQGMSAYTAGRRKEVAPWLRFRLDALTASEEAGRLWSEGQQGELCDHFRDLSGQQRAEHIQTCPNCLSHAINFI